MTNTRDYYCSRKFTEMSVDLEHRTVAACCSARPERVNFEDLSQNGLLNNSVIKQDRQHMLENIRVKSCEHYCWNIEDHELPSPRLETQSNVQDYQTAEVTELKSLNLIFGSRCTLTCSYCNKGFSRAWAQDIEKHGNYSIATASDIYTLNTKDKIIKNLDQHTLYSGQHFELLYEQIIKLKHSVGTVYITGGEPFLYESLLLQVVATFPQSVNIVILTGTGVLPTKFSAILTQLEQFSNVTLGISAENLYQLYEFNRFGNTFENFVEIYKMVTASKLKYKFYSTLSNLTVFGYLDFVNFVDAEISENTCNDPEFLRVSMLDNNSRLELLEQYDKQNNSKFNSVIKLLNVDTPVSIVDKNNLSTFLVEFSSRRKLDLNIFPKTFLDWLNIHVVQ